MGASAASIVVLLSRDFVKLVLIALGIALPLAWFGMQQWLNNYPYRVSISVGAFALVAAGAVLVAIGTVSYQTIKAALMNPVKSLKRSSYSASYTSNNNKSFDYETIINRLPPPHVMGREPPAIPGRLHADQH